MAFSLSNKNSASALANSVLPTPVGPKNKKLPIGLLGSFKPALALRTAAMKEKVMQSLREHFRPEFLNRIDETVVFHALTAEELKRIVNIQLKILNKRLADRNLVLDMSTSALEWLARTGYDPVYGARPLKRLIQKEIENPLSLKLLQGEFKDGDKIILDLHDEKLTWQKVDNTVKV